MSERGALKVYDRAVKKAILVECWQRGGAEEGEGEEEVKRDV